MRPTSLVHIKNLSKLSILCTHICKLFMRLYRPTLCWRYVALVTMKMVTTDNIYPSSLKHILVKIESWETFGSWKSQAKISLAITPSRGHSKGHIIWFLYIIWTICTLIVILYHKALREISYHIWRKKFIFTNIFVKQKELLNLTCTP